MEKSEYCEKSVTEVPDCENVKNDSTVTYLYRSSTKERVFVPENHGNDKDKKTDGYIAFDKGEDVRIEKNVSGISSHLVRKNGNKKLESKDDSSSEEDFQVPRKKPRKEWVVDKNGAKQKPKYHPVNLIKLARISPEIPEKYPWLETATFITIPQGETGWLEIPDVVIVKYIQDII